MLYFFNDFKSSLCVALPRNKLGRISTGSAFSGSVGKFVELSQSDDSVELLHVESENGSEILSDL
jgi:hypothetical protein